MKTKIFTLFLMAIGFLASTSAFAQNETDVSMNVAYTYSISNGNGDWSGSNTYAWSVAPGTGWTSTLSNALTNNITWTAPGTYVITIQATDTKGCYSEPIELTVVVTDETYCISNQTNTTTCSLIDAGTGNNTSSFDDDFTFDVVLSHPSTSGTYTINFTIDGTAGSKTITGVVAGTDETATITVPHSEFTTEFTNNTSTNKPVPVVITSVTNNSTTAVSECASPFTFENITVNPKPVISFN